MKNDRDWNDPDYKAWRLAVYKRDCWTCQFPGCGRKGVKAKLQAHHIKRWADFPELRFQLSNGITLCRRCHDNIGRQEELFEPTFRQILSSKPEGKISKSVSDSVISAKKLLYATEDIEGDAEF